MKSYIDLGKGVIATDDDGDGVYDDVHHVTHSPTSSGVIYYDGDGDGIYDDSTFAVRINDDPDSHQNETSHSTTPSSGSDVSSSYKSSRLFTGKTMLKIIAIVAGSFAALSLLTRLVIFIITLLVA